MIKLVVFFNQVQTRLCILSKTAVEYSSLSPFYSRSGPIALPPGQSHIFNVLVKLTLKKRELPGDEAK